MLNINTRSDFNITDYTGNFNIISQSSNSSFKITFLIIVAEINYACLTFVKNRNIEINFRKKKAVNILWILLM